MMSDSSTDDSWRKNALCKKYKDIDFFSEDILSIRKSLNICKQCVVAVECLKHSIDQKESYGIWGCSTQRERRKIIKNKINLNDRELKQIVLKNGNNVLS